jgi:hypothetical protein
MVAPLPKLKLKTNVVLPAKIVADSIITVVKESGTYTFGIDYEQITEAAITDPATAMILILDRDTSSYVLQSLSDLIAGALQVGQHITAAGPVSIDENAGVVRVDQTVGAAITLNMPEASAKTCPVLISDWKGDAGTHNITVTLTGSDTFPGGFTTWTIAADTGSIFLRPISGVGYAI